MKKLILVLCGLALGASLATCKKWSSGAPPDGAVIIATADAADEVEPNNRIEEANLLTPGRPIRGRLWGPGGKPDIDHFRVVCREARGILRAEVSGVPGLDLALDVFRLHPRRRLASANNARAGLGEVIPNVGVVQGEYVIVVRAAQKKATPVESPYTLTVTISPVGEGDELEPNDVRVDAQEVEPGRRIQGFFGKRKDVDWYRLKLPETQGEAILRTELTAVSGVPFVSLEVQDEIEVVLKKGRSARGAGVLFPNLFVKPNQRFLYLAASGGQGFNVTDRYTLETTLQPVTSLVEREPNDRPPQATPLPVGERLQGYLAPVGDEDWFALDAAEPSIGRIAVTGLDQVDLALALHDAAGKEVVLVDEGREREGEVIPNAPLPKGRSLVRVFAKKPRENVFQTYELTAELARDTGEEEHEPNNTTAMANALTVGARKRGLIYPRKDVDVYRLDLTGQSSARPLKIEVKGIPKVPLQLVLKEMSGVATQVGPRAPEENLVLEKHLLPGVYHLEISGGGLSNPRDRYELRVSVP
jgi:hypothetical protein